MSTKNAIIILGVMAVVAGPLFVYLIFNQGLIGGNNRGIENEPKVITEEERKEKNRQALMETMAEVNKIGGNDQLTEEEREQRRLEIVDTMAEVNKVGGNDQLSEEEREQRRLELIEAMERAAGVGGVGRY